jgi:hypothetical protein
LKLNNISDKDNTEIFTSYHRSQFDSNLLNKAIEKAINDKKFITSSLNLIKDIEFPTYKYKIINHVQKLTNDKMVIALFYTLSESLEFKDIKHIKNILEANIPAKNSAHNTKNPDKLNVNPLSSSQKISDVKEKDPTESDTMREYICNKCGKPFFTREDLRIHQNFEGK